MIGPQNSFLNTYQLSLAGENEKRQSVRFEPCLSWKSIFSFSCLLSDSHKDDDGSIANQEIKRKLSTSQTEGGGAETHYEAEDTSTILNEYEEESTVVAPVSPLMQAIKKEVTPDPSVMSETSEAIPPTPMGSRSMDSRLVLAYTSTNKFDVAGNYKCLLLISRVLDFI